MRFCVFDARFPPLSGVFFICALLAGCAAPQSRALQSTPPPLLSGAVEMDQSPFFPQEAFQCGPAALATTLNAAGISAMPEDLARQVFLPARRGSLQVEMLAAARRRVRESRFRNGSSACLFRRNGKMAAQSTGVAGAWQYRVFPSGLASRR